MSEVTTVARPYAKAVFDFAVENHCVDKWQDMLAFIAKLVCNQQIKKILSGLMVAPKILTEIFVVICDNKIDKHVENFILTMAENGRLSILPEVLKQFIQLRAFLESIIKIEVICATKLNKKQQVKISAALEKRLLHKVKLNCKIDKSIIAGVIIRVGDLVIDSSIRSRIKRLANFLQS